MLLFLPLSTSDRNHATSHAKLLRAFGPYPEDRALILPTPDAFHDPLFKKVIEDLVSCFTPDNVRVEVTPNNFDGGWPYGPNCHFKFAMETANIMGWDNEEMMWMEADLNPTRHGWLQQVKTDYKVGSTPFRGMLCDTRLEITDPKTKEVTPKYTGTKHLVGAGIYPAGYIRYICPINKSPMASFRTPSYVMPFDVRCEAQHLPATQSPLWLHKPRTVNWARVNGTVFTCEDKTQDRWGLAYAGPVDLANICLVHGPKDDSFANAILSGLPLSPTIESYAASQPPKIYPAPQPTSQSETVNQGGGTTQSVVDAIAVEKRRSEVLVEEIAGLKQDIELQLQDNKELRGENDSLKAQVEALSQLKDASVVDAGPFIAGIQGMKDQLSKSNLDEPAEATKQALKSVKPPAKRVAKKPAMAGA